MATNNNNQNGWLSGLNINLGSPIGHLSVVPEQQSSSSAEMNQFEQIDRTSNGSNTLKVCEKNPNTSKQCLITNFIEES